MPHVTTPATGQWLRRGIAAEVEQALPTDTRHTGGGGEGDAGGAASTSGRRALAGDERARARALDTEQLMIQTGAGTRTEVGRPPPPGAQG